MRPLALTCLCLLLASCATQGPAPSSPAERAALTTASPECQAARLRPVEPMPASMVPDEVLRRAQSGFVVVRYDLVGGRLRNAVVVDSQPAGLYDAYVLRHAATHTDPTGATVRGCIMTTQIKF